MDNVGFTEYRDHYWRPRKVEDNIMWVYKNFGYDPIADKFYIMEGNMVSEAIRADFDLLLNHEKNCLLTSRKWARKNKNSLTNRTNDQGAKTNKVVKKVEKKERPGSGLVIRPTEK